MEIHLLQHMDHYKSSPLAVILTNHSVLMIDFSFLTHIWFWETVVFYSICKAEDNMMEGGDEGVEIFFLLLYSCIMHATALHISRAFWTFIYTNTRWCFQLAVDCILWLRWACMSEDHTPSGKCGGWLPCARGKRKEWDRGDADLQEGCVKEKCKAITQMRQRPKWASPQFSFVYFCQEKTFLKGGSGIKFNSVMVY